MEISAKQLEELQKSIRALTQKLNQTAEIAVLPEVITNEGFIKALRISRRVAFEWRKQGKIKYSHLAHKIFYLKENLLQFIREHEVVAENRQSNGQRYD